MVIYSNSSFTDAGEAPFNRTPLVPPLIPVDPQADICITLSQPSLLEPTDMSSVKTRVFTNHCIDFLQPILSLQMRDLNIKQIEENGPATWL